MLSRPPNLKQLPLLALAAACALAQAQALDRQEPLVVESDGRQAAVVDLARKLTTLNGNVVLTQGGLTIRADKVEVREVDKGRYTARAYGSPGRPATFRQKRERDEVVEAESRTIDYDGNSDRVRLVGDAKLRVIRSGVPADEASAEVIVYDRRAQTVGFEGSAQTGDKPAGRARLVFTPRASEPAPAASAPGSSK